MLRILNDFVVGFVVILLNICPRYQKTNLGWVLLCRRRMDNPHFSFSRIQNNLNHNPHKNLFLMHVRCSKFDQTDGRQTYFLEFTCWKGFTHRLSTKITIIQNKRLISRLRLNKVITFYK